MNKDKQIEEIEQFIYDYVDSKQTERVYLCSSRVNALAKPFVHNKTLATALYNAGYRKVDNIGDFTVYGFKNGYVKALIEKDKEIERLKADNEALKMWNEAYTEENKKLEKQLADLQTNTAEAIGGIYSGHFSAQEQFAIYVKREIDKIFEPFISKDDNNTEN